MPLRAQEHIFELNVPIFRQMWKKQPFLKSTHSSTTFFKLVENMNVIEDLSLNYTSWLPLDTNTNFVFFDHQSHLRIYSYFCVDTRQCAK